MVALPAGLNRDLPELTVGLTSTAVLPPTADGSRDRLRDPVADRRAASGIDFATRRQPSAAPEPTSPVSVRADSPADNGARVRVGLFGRLCLRALAEGAISESKAAELLGIGIADVDDYMRGVPPSPPAAG